MVPIKNQNVICILCFNKLLVENRYLLLDFHESLYLTVI